MLKVAFVMNPVAGLGGPLALKGSDNLSDEIRELHRGHAMDRSKLFLESLRNTRARLNEEIHWVSVLGPMGGDLFDFYQIDYQSVHEPSLPSSAWDTIESVQLFEQSDCDLIVFRNESYSSGWLVGGFRSSNAPRSNAPPKLDGCLDGCQHGRLDGPSSRPS